MSLAKRRHLLRKDPAPPEALSDPEQSTSAACARAGLFALALSLSLGALLPAWEEQRDELQIGRYVLTREELRLSLAELDTDPDWKRRLASQPDLEDRSVAELAKLLFQQPDIDTRWGSLTIHADVPQAMPVPASASPTPPIPHVAASRAPVGILPPPSNLRVEFTLDELVRVESALQTLGDTDFLDQVRRASGKYDLLIYRWLRRANKLLLVQDRSDSPHVAVVQGTASQVDPRSPQGRLPLETLSLRRVRELSAYEVVQLDLSGQIQARRGKQVEIAVGALPKNLLYAAIALEVMIAFTLSYFAAFVMEAKAISRFPSAGTVFAAFARTRTTRASFLLALSVPPACAVLTAWVSRELALAALALLIGAITAWVASLVWPYRHGVASQSRPASSVHT